MPGYFPDDSTAVRVMRSRAVGLTYGQRALVIGAANPLLFEGTIAHTSRPELPFHRLSLTARMFETVFLGSKQDADRVLEFTRRRHASVVGALPADAGPHHAAGEPYRADDPQLMFLTMACAFDSVEAMHDLLVHRLSGRDREALYRDFVRWAELFGMPRSAAPDSYAGFRDVHDAWLASDGLHVGAHARAVGGYLTGSRRGDYDTPRPLRPVFRTLELLVRGSLPARIRELYGFRWSPAHEAAFRAAARSVRAIHLRPPLVHRPLDPILHGPSRRMFAVVAGREEHEHRQGRLSMPAHVAAMRARTGPTTTTGS